MNVRVPVLLLLGVAIAAGVFVACGGGDDGPKPTPTPVRVDLGDGEYIDSYPEGAGIASGLQFNTLEQLASSVEFIAVVEVTSIKDTLIPTAGAGTLTPMDRKFQYLPWTTYNMRVTQWLKGDGPDEITVTIVGGEDYDGHRYYEGTFLPTVGRTYVMPLQTRPAEAPGDGDYEGTTSGATTFEVTDGTVRVLSNSKTQPLVEGIEGITLEELIDRVADWIFAGPVLTPSPTAS